MHVKYRQDTLHRMTWYTGTCGSNGHGLTIHVSFIVKCVCYTGLWIHWFCDPSATISNGSVTIGWMSIVGVPLKVRLDCTTNVTYGMLCNVWGTGIVL
jgi:hypothetical protein